MSGQTPDRDDDIVLAGEYALNLLPDDAAAEFEARLAAEPELRAIYAAWAEDLAHLSDRVTPVTPPAALRDAIEHRLFGADRAAPRPGLFERFGLAGLAVAVVVAGLFLGSDLLERAPLPPADPAYTAQLASEDGGLQVAAAYDADTGQLFLDRQAGAADEGRALELWLIAGDAAPVSLGLLEGGPVTVLSVTTDLRGTLQGGVLAISDEPAGGSPTGAPTGAVLAAAPITDT